MEPSFVLNGSTLMAIGTVMGGLTGAIVYLSKKLIDSKDQEIGSKDVEVQRLLEQLETMRRTLSMQTEMMRSERDYFMDVAFKKPDPKP